MIIQSIFNILFALADFFVGLFPRFPSFQNLSVSLEPVLYVIKFVNMFINIKVVSTCLITILIVYNINFVWSILMWLVRKIPGVS